VLLDDLRPSGGLLLGLRRRLRLLLLALAGLDVADRPLEQFATEVK